LLLRGSIHLGYASGNAGSLLFNHILARPDGSIPALVIPAERLLNRAVTLSSHNNSAWRTLGFILAIKGQERAARVAWQSANGMTEEFIQRGEKARHSGRYDEALVWYERGQAVDPSLGDWHYYKGLAYEGMGQWEEALAVFQSALSLPVGEIGKSDIYYQIGWLQSRRIRPLDFEAALRAFDRAITQNQFSNDMFVISSHYERGETLRRLGLYREAWQEYEWVIGRRPEHYGALVNLGLLYWQIEQDAGQAEVKLAKAISLRPNIKWAYLGLAGVYQESGREFEAMNMYKQVLILDPQDSVAHQQINRLSPSEGDVK
jgi:tetratricopeptide (TPR) repeat protein